MDWTQTLTIILSLAAFIAFWMNRVESRIEKDINRIDVDLKSQGARIDQLYQMFIDLLKEGKK